MRRGGEKNKKEEEEEEKNIYRYDVTAQEESHYTRGDCNYRGCSTSEVFMCSCFLYNTLFCFPEIYTHRLTASLKQS